ncbi:MAG: hypothetical protein JWM19_4884 [Actinomycetia bacterium]|nr:hypothetical protein [Actinomycetes bacterium]
MAANAEAMIPMVNGTSGRDAVWALACWPSCTPAVKPTKPS